MHVMVLLVVFAVVVGGVGGQGMVLFVIGGVQQHSSTHVDTHLNQHRNSPSTTTENKQPPTQKHKTKSNKKKSKPLKAKTHSLYKFGLITVINR